MKKFLAIAATGATLALTSGAASASTCDGNPLSSTVCQMKAGGLNDYDPSVAYLFTYTILSGGASSVSYNFDFGNPADTNTTANVQVNGSSLTDGQMAWYEFGTTHLASSIVDLTTTLSQPLALSVLGGSKYTLKVWWGNALIPTSSAPPQITGSVVSAVPLPATGIMLLGSLGALGVAKRRKKKVANA